MAKTPDVPTLLRQARRHAGLSQRELARRAQTSSAAVSQYESGRKAPRIDTLERLLEVCGLRLELRAVPLTSNRDRAAARSLALHRAGARRLDDDPDAVLVAARRNLTTMRAIHADGSADRWLDAWAALLDGPVIEVARVLTEESESAHELRQNTPFAGILSASERWDIYREHAA